MKFTRITSPCRSAGFNLIELVVALGISGLVLAAAAPSFNGFMHRIRTEATLTELSTALMKARREAILRSVTVVAQPLPATRELLIYANVDGDDLLEYQPDSTALPRTADYQVSRVEMPLLSKVSYRSPSGLGNGNGNGRGNGNGNGGGNGNGNGNGGAVVQGLTNLSSGENGLVFDADGSIRDVGGLRVGDEFGNYFELRAGPAATGKITVFKFRENPPWGDEPGFYPRGSDPNGVYPMWSWTSAEVASGPRN